MEGDDPTPGTWYLTNFTFGTADTDDPTPGHFKVDFFIAPNEDGQTTESALEAECNTPSSEKLKCSMEEINGRTWAWIHSRITSYKEDPDIQGIRVVTFANGNSYTASGIVPSGKGQEEGIGQIEDIFRSFVIHET